MSVVRFFAPENRLGKAIRAPGGKHVHEAIADADKQILLAADECLAKIDEALERVFRLSAEVKGAPSDDLYKAVREVTGLAGLAGLDDLGVAALSFCTLLDQAQQSGRLNDEQMQVHLGVLRLLRRPERFSQAERQQILDNLREMMSKTQRDLAAKAAG